MFVKNQKLQKVRIFTLTYFIKYLKREILSILYLLCIDLQNAAGLDTRFEQNQKGSPCELCVFKLHIISFHCMKKRKFINNTLLKLEVFQNLGPMHFFFFSTYLNLNSFEDFLLFPIFSSVQKFLFCCTFYYKMLYTFFSNEREKSFLSINIRIIS